MIIPKLQKLPHEQLSPNTGKFIVNPHRIDAPDAMVRSNLTLDAPNFCGSSRSMNGLEWLCDENIPQSSDTM